MSNLDNFRKAVKNPKSSNSMGLHLSKNYIRSAKILYVEDFSNITFNYLCENLPNYLCHFWNHNSFFTTQLVYIVLAQMLHTLNKNIPSKWKFSEISVLKLKFIKFLMPFFKEKWVFLETLHHCPVSWETTLLYFFNWNCTWFGQKEPIKVQNFRLSTTHVISHQFVLW